MTDLTLIAIWLVAASLMFFSGTLAIVAMGLAWLLKEERRGGVRGAWSRPEAGRHGCEIERRCDGPHRRPFPQEAE